MISIFKKSVELNSKIETFLDTISDSLLLFEKVINAYLKNDQDTFNETLDRICVLETKADELESEIKVNLYKYLLLPDTRADVLSLVKSLDNIIDATEEIVKEFNIQKPHFPSDLHHSLLDLTRNSVKTAEELLHASRSFFNEVHLVNAQINKVKFFEHETDILEDKISNMIFNGNVVDTLAEKLQLKDFVTRIADISDECEVIGDKLTIFTIKREI